MPEPDYTESNRAAWNQAAPFHARQQLDHLLALFSQPGASTLDATLTALLRDRVGLEGKTAAQLSCNNGRETLSLRNLGTARCVGFDISDEFIAQARLLNQTAGLDVEFVRTDLYAIPAAYDRSFDLLLITIGTLGWLPDLPGAFQVMARLLRPGGKVVFYEMHPILDMFDQDDTLTETPAPRHSYFKTEPFADQEGLDYYGNEQYQGPTSYWFHHRLADVINELLRQGFLLEWFEEYGHDLTNEFASFERCAALLPLSYSLIARLPE